MCVFVSHTHTHAHLHHLYLHHRLHYDRVVELATGDVLHFTYIRDIAFSTHLHSGVDRKHVREHGDSKNDTEKKEQNGNVVVVAVCVRVCFGAKLFV